MKMDQVQGKERPSKDQAPEKNKEVDSRHARHDSGQERRKPAEHPVIPETNARTKAAMARELAVMGLSAKAIERLLHL